MPFAVDVMVWIAFLWSKKKTAEAIWVGVLEKREVKRNSPLRSGGGLHGSGGARPRRTGEVRSIAGKAWALEITLSVSRRKRVYYEWISMW